MEQRISIFGAALDALSSPERINLKIAYLNYLKNEALNQQEFKDPYDFVKRYLTENRILNDINNRVRWAGKISVPSWLTPKPSIDDLPKLSTEKLDKFLKSNGCWKYALAIADYINKEIYSSMPVMIGVDHSLTGGSIMALVKKFPNLNIIILDAHFDVMNKDSQTDGTLINYYECGNFLNCLLEKKIISPKNLWILGVQDEICQELKQMSNSQRNLDSNTVSIKKWMAEGVHVIFKKEVQSNKFKMDLSGPSYLSIDMDVGSMSSIYSARFMNSFGLRMDEFLQLLNRVSRLVESSNRPLVGMDIMELDMHFLEVAKKRDFNDYTEQIIEEIFKIFVNKGNKNLNNKSFIN